LPEKSDEPEYACSICKDMGFLVQDGEDPWHRRTVICECRKPEMIRGHRERLHNASGVPVNHQADMFSDLDVSHPKTQEMYRASLDWIAGICEGKTPKSWLVLLGERGNGKTHMAYSAVNFACDNSIDARYYYFPDLLDDLRQAYKDDTYTERMSELKEQFVLVLDDIGAEKSSDWSDEVLTKLIDYRYRHEKYTMLIANANLTDLSSRIADRMRDAGLVQIVINTAPSYRPMKGKSR